MRLCRGYPSPHQMPAGYDTSEDKPLRKRAHTVFLSHAHMDAKAVLRLRQWLKVAGIEVWFDREKMRAGQTFPSALAEGIADSRAMIVAISGNTRASEWVKYEADQGLAQQGRFPQFGVIPVRLDPCNLPANLAAHSAVDAFQGNLDDAGAASLLRSIHGVPDLSPPEDLKTQVIHHVSRLANDPPSDLTSVRVPVLYVTCGWRNAPNETAMRDTVRRALARRNIHLLGDAEDHPHTVETRIKSILSGCSGQVVILPRRAGTRQLSDQEYHGLRAELLWGQEVGLPQWIVVEKGLELPAALKRKALVVQPVGPGAAGTRFEVLLSRWAAELSKECQVPANPHFVIVASDFDDRVIKDHVIRHIEQITGLPCLKGSDFGRQIPSRKIELALGAAALVIANVVSSTKQGGQPEVNWNSCIEAGIAMGARRQLHIIARRKATDRWRIDKSLPFMIRHNSVETYCDDQHLIALVHKFSRPFRRRVIA